MATRTLNAPAPGATVLELRAAQAELDVTVDPECNRAQVELTGPSHTIESARTTNTGQSWTVDLPTPDPATVTVSGGATVTTYGGDVIIQGAAAGSVVSTGGTTVINNSTVTTDGPQVQVRVRVPQDSRLRTRITNGQVRVLGHLSEIDHQGHNLSLRLDSADDVAADVHNGSLAIGRSTECVEATTHNGSIRLNATGERTFCSTHNGSIDITAASDGPIRARTHNGPITVNTNGHNPKVSTRTRNGSERIT